MRSATVFFVAMVAICVLAFLFQTFVRYRYEQIDGQLWRVDEMSNVRCIVAAPNTPCLPPKSTSVSTSTSSSLSSSVSTSVNARSHARLNTTGGLGSSRPTDRRSEKS
jgi:hypothetical protein